MSKMWVCATAMSFAVLGAGQANAEVDLKTVCVTDFFKFCSNVERGGGRIIACLKSHLAELEPACADGLKQLDAEKAAQQPKAQ